VDSQILSFFTLLLGLGAGVVLGWFLGSRPAAEWKARFAARDLDARELDEKFRRAIVDLEQAEALAQRADELAARLDEARERTEGLSADLATLRANAAHFEEQKRLMLEAQEALRKEFENAQR